MYQLQGLFETNALAYFAPDRSSTNRCPDGLVDLIRLWVCDSRSRRCHLASEAQRKKRCHAHHNVVQRHRTHDVRQLHSTSTEDFRHLLQNTPTDEVMQQTWQDWMGWPVSSVFGTRCHCSMVAAEALLPPPLLPSATCCCWAVAAAAAYCHRSNLLPLRVPLSLKPQAPAVGYCCSCQCRCAQLVASPAN
jgi:hypothetical protein